MPKCREVAFFVARTCAPTCASSRRAAQIWPTARFNQKDISIQLAREALRDLLSIQNRQISVENIQKTVADYYKIKVADMYSKSAQPALPPRQIAMYLARELTQKACPRSASCSAAATTTVLHAVRKMGAKRQQHRAEPATARAGADPQRLMVKAPLPNRQKPGPPCLAAAKWGWPCPVPQMPPPMPKTTKG